MELVESSLERRPSSYRERAAQVKVILTKCGSGSLSVADPRNLIPLLLIQ